MASDLRPVVGAVLKWRRELQRDVGTARARTARLKRASSALEALMLEETLDLVRAARRAREGRVSGDFDQRLVVLAMTLVRIEGEGRASLARALGQPSGDERPRLPPSRFGALMRSAHRRDWDGFARALRRALAMLGDARIDVARFVGDVLFLNDATLRRWAYDYWQTDAPADDEAAQPAANDLETAP